MIRSENITAVGDTSRGYDLYPVFSCRPTGRFEITRPGFGQQWLEVGPHGDGGEKWQRYRSQWPKETGPRPPKG